MKPWLKQDWIISGFLIFALAWVGYGFLWRQGEVVYSPHSDTIVYGLGTKTVLHKSVAGGQGIPFWRDDQLSGYPAFSNPQALYTYPLDFLFYFLEPANAVGGTLWFHFVLGAVGLYLVGGVLGLGNWARVLMAACAMFSFKRLLAAYAGWLPVIPSITCVPLLFAATFYLTNRKDLRATLTFCGAVAFCLHTGHLQLIYYAMWFVMAYLTAKAITSLRDGEWEPVRQVAWRLFGGGMLGVGMVAYLLIPLAGEAHLLSRSELSYTNFVSDHALGLRHLLTFLYPEAIGNPLEATVWEDIAYFGILPLLLAVVGAVLGWRRNPYTRFFVAAFFVSVIAAMDTPLLRLFYNVLPGFKLFRCPSRFLFLSSFFGITLAGIGLDEVIRRARGDWRRRFIAPILTGTLLFVVSAEGIWYVRQYLQTVPHREVIPKTAYQEFFASDNTVFRIATLYGPTINYGWAAAMDLQMISGYEPFNLKHYQDYFDLLQHGTIGSRKARHFLDLTRISRADLLDALNVKYLVSPAPLQGPGGRFEQVGHWKDQPIFEFFAGMTRGDIYVYLNRGFLPRAYWAKEVIAVEDERQMATILQERKLGHSALVLETKGRPVPGRISSGGQVEISEASGGFLALQVQNTGPGFLNISEVWHPGWTASIDGQDLGLRRANLALMGVWVPSGEHRVELRFRPMYWSLGVAVSLVSLCIFVALLCLTVLRSWKPEL